MLVPPAARRDRPDPDRRRRARRPAGIGRHGEAARDGGSRGVRPDLGQASRAESDLTSALNQIARLAREGVLDRNALEQAEQAAADARARMRGGPGQASGRFRAARRARAPPRRAPGGDRAPSRGLEKRPLDPLTGRWRSSSTRERGAASTASRSTARSSRGTMSSTAGFMVRSGARSWGTASRSSGSTPSAEWTRSSTAA